MLLLVPLVRPGEFHPEPFYLRLQGCDLLVLERRPSLELPLELLVREAAVVVVMDRGVELSLHVVRDSPVVVVDLHPPVTRLQQGAD